MVTFTQGKGVRTYRFYHCTAHLYVVMGPFVQTQIAADRKKKKEKKNKGIQLRLLRGLIK